VEKTKKPAAAAGYDKDYNVFFNHPIALHFKKNKFAAFASQVRTPIGRLTVIEEGTLL
jgi:hypothetical protein